jgi:hypothetical protein
LTGQALTTAIGTFAPGFDVTGVSATVTVNDVTPQDQIDVSVTGIDMTSTVNNVSPGIFATGIGLTFAIGTETINHDRIFELDNGGVSITGTVNNQSFDTRTGVLNGISATGSIGTIDNNSQVGVTGVVGTGDVGTFGESGDGTLNLSIQGVGIEGDIGTGIEIAESEIPESNTNGWGENAFGYGIWGGDPEVKGIGGVGTVTLDIFKGPNPQTGIAMTGTVGNFIVQGNLSVTGVSGTGTVNNVTLNTNVDATEIGATTAIGTYSVSINPGWGEGTWNEGTWGN